MIQLDLEEEPRGRAGELHHVRVRRPWPWEPVCLLRSGRSLLCPCLIIYPSPGSREVWGAVEESCALLGLGSGLRLGLVQEWLSHPQTSLLPSGHSDVPVLPFLALRTL